MKKLTLILFLSFPFLVFGQVDTAAVVREVDSLQAIWKEFYSAGKYAETVETAKMAGKIAWENLGTMNIHYANCLNAQGTAWFRMGKFEEAESVYLELKSIRKNILGANHAQYVSSLNNLGNLYASMGQYEKSEILLLEAKTKREKMFGTEHIEYANSLGNLAILYGKMSRFEEAEQLYLESKAIKEKILPEEDPGYIRVLSNLGVLYMNMGLYQAAFQLQQRVLAIREKTVGKEHPDYATSMVNLGGICFKMDQLDSAEYYLREALSFYDKLSQTESISYSICLENLSNCYRLKGLFEKAELLTIKSMDIVEKVVGREHYSYAVALHNLADIRQKMGRYAEALKYYTEANVIWNKLFVKFDPNYCLNLKAQAECLEKLGNDNSYRQIILEAVSIQRTLLQRASKHLSEKELFELSNTLATCLPRILSYAANNLEHRDELLKVAFDDFLFYKEFLLSNASTIKNQASEDSTTFLLKSLHRRLAAEYAKPLADRWNVPDLEEKANVLEKELVRTVAGYGEAIRQVTWQEVQAALKPGEAAIEFVHFHKNFPNSTDSVMYAALVLRPGWEAPRWVGLFEEKQLTALFETKSGKRADEVNSLYYRHKSKRNLYDLIWQPLEAAMGDVETIYFSPSGLLHRLNLEAIPKPASTQDSPLRLVQLGSTRQLVVSPPAAAANDLAAVFGGIRYDMDSAAIAKANEILPESWSGTRGELQFSYVDSTLRGGDWKYLQWSDVEAVALNKLLKNNGLQPSMRRGYAATEESFKTLGNPSPRIIHLATHGFFFPDVRGEGQDVRGGQEEPVFKISEHPMIRAGLILAGGNHAWKTGKPLKPSMEDGILTAYEISQMNLSNTELVVLSACETGLGDIQGNEGVFGLQRAFKIAGAKYVLMSLWQVPDFQTQEMMTAFYTHWLEAKRSIPDAFRAAQQAMKSKYPEPFNWAGFVLVE